VNALKFLRPAFGALALSEITAEAVENYLGIDFSPGEEYTQSSDFSCEARKPHYMSATEQAKIEIVAPSYLRNILVIISELGLRYKKEFTGSRAMGWG